MRCGWVTQGANEMPVALCLCTHAPAYGGSLLRHTEAEGMLLPCHLHTTDHSLGDK